MCMWVQCTCTCMWVQCTGTCMWVQCTCTSMWVQCTGTCMWVQCTYMYVCEYNVHVHFPYMKITNIDDSSDVFKVL